jgi:hypothetical protein
MFKGILTLILNNINAPDWSYFITEIVVILSIFVSISTAILLITWLIRTKYEKQKIKSVEMAEIEKLDN